MKEERRTYALDLLRYMRISGFELSRTGMKSSSFAQVVVEAMETALVIMPVFNCFYDYLVATTDVYVM